MKKKKEQKNEQWESVFATMERNAYDPLGSYTGRPTNPKERPVQDADDL